MRPAAGLRLGSLLKDIEREWALYLTYAVYILIASAPQTVGRASHVQLLSFARRGICAPDCFGVASWRARLRLRQQRCAGVRFGNRDRRICPPLGRSLGAQGPQTPQGPVA